MHATRHPLSIISSLYHRPLRLDRPWGRYLLQHFDPPTLDPMGLAVWRYATFTRMAEQHASLTVRVEDRAKAIQALCQHVNRPLTNDELTAATGIPASTNQHHHNPRLAWSDIPDGPHKDYAQAAAERFGYDMGATQDVGKPQRI